MHAFKDSYPLLWIKLKEKGIVESDSIYSRKMITCCQEIRTECKLDLMITRFASLDHVCKSLEEALKGNS